MNNLHTLKLNASSIGSAAPRGVEPEKDADASPTQEISVVEASAPAPRPVRAPATGLLKRLVGLAAVELAGTLAAVAATGSVHNTIFRIAIAGLAIAVAAVVAVESFAPRRRKAAAAPEAAAASRPAHSKKGLNKTRVALLFMMAIGFATYFGGGGTFSSFTAQTGNPNETIASGSLLLQNTFNANPVCESKSGAANDNVNFNCNTLFAFGTYGNLQPGVYAGSTASLTLTNSGTLDAAKVYMFAPYANGVLSSWTLTGGNVTQLTLSTSGGPNGLEGNITNGDTIVVTSGGVSQSFTANGASAAGATTVSVNAAAPTAAVAAGATVEDTSSDTSAANTNCYDTQVTNLGFNPTMNNPLCSAAMLLVQETTGGKHYCWWGSGAGSANGMCDLPVSVVPSGLSSNTTIAAGTYTIGTAGGLNGNIKSGDHIAFTENGNQAWCTASTDYYTGATSIVLTSTCGTSYGANNVYDNSATITDLTSLQRVASDGTHSISQFDQNAKTTSHIELTPVTANGTAPLAAIDLAHGASRNFVIGIVIPGPASAQNTIQALKSTFGISWQLSQ
jgi:hypothetical protein